MIIDYDLFFDTFLSKANQLDEGIQNNRYSLIESLDVPMRDWAIKNYWSLYNNDLNALKLDLRECMECAVSEFLNE